MSLRSVASRVIIEHFNLIGKLIKQIKCVLGEYLN